MPDDNDDVEVSARPFWSGTITFGLVSVPVELLPANRSNRGSLRMLSPEGVPLARRYFTERDDEVLEWDDIVRGYEMEKEEYVVVDDEDLDKLAPERSRDIDLRLFAKASEIDPMHFERAYYLTPGGETTKAYRLLAKVMEESDRAGIATFVMRGKEYLIAILAENGVLRAETLRFADEIRTPAAVGLPEPRDPDTRTVNRFAKEIEKLSKPRLDTSELVDGSVDRLEKLAKKKAKAGKDVVRFDPDRDEQSRDVIDLMALLQQSLKGETPPSPAKRTAAKPKPRKSKPKLATRSKK